MSTDPRNQPLFLATDDPSGNPATEGSLSSPAMTLERELYVSITSGGGQVVDANPPEAYPGFAQDTGIALKTQSALFALNNLDPDPSGNSWNGVDGYFYDSVGGFPVIDPAAGEDRHTAIVTAAINLVLEPGGTMTPLELTAASPQVELGAPFSALPAASIGYVSDGVNFGAIRHAVAFASGQATTSTAVEVVAAPGAGNRIRLLGYRFMDRGATVAALAARLAFLSTEGAALPFERSFVLNTTATVQADGAFVWLGELGFPLAEDENLEIDIDDVLAAGALRVLVHYVVEPIP